MILIMRSLLLLALVSSSIRLEVRAQTPDSTPEPRLAWPVALFVGETIVFGTAALTKSKTGARVVGAIEGLSGLHVLWAGASGDPETADPEFMIPYGLGLMGLASYNLLNADSPRSKKRFWVNVIGLNVAALAGTITRELAGPHNSGGAAARMSPAAFRVTIRF